MITKPFAPLLAKPVEWQHLDYSNTWVSKKLDGIRAIIIGGVVVSRKLLPIPNMYVQEAFGNRPELEGYDGELICGPANADNVYSRTYSAVMAVHGVSDVIFHAFDHITHPTEEYHLRQNRLAEHRWVVKVPQHPVLNEQGVLNIEQMYLDQGFEGVMLRAFHGPNSFYKYGRSTAKAGTLLKLKRFTDAEATIIGFEEQMFNGNITSRDALGHTKRSSHAENKVGKDTLGALVCRDIESGAIFNIGTGFDDETKQHIWDERETLLDDIVKYKSFRIGVKDAPRFPVYLGMRSPLDM